MCSLFFPTFPCSLECYAVPGRVQLQKGRVPVFPLGMFPWMPAMVPFGGCKADPWGSEGLCGHTQVLAVGTPGLQAALRAAAAFLQLRGNEELCLKLHRKALWEDSAVLDVLQTYRCVLVHEAEQEAASQGRWSRLESRELQTKLEKEECHNEWQCRKLIRKWIEDRQWVR